MAKNIGAPKKEKSADALSLRDILHYQRMALSFLFRQSPGYLLYRIIASSVEGIEIFCVNTLFLHWLLNTAEQTAKSGSEGFWRIALFAVGVYGFDYLFLALQDLLRRSIYARGEAKCRVHLQKRLFEKACEVELACFEEPAFYDRYVKAMDGAGGQMHSVITVLSTLLSLFVNLLLGGGFLFTMDPLLFLMLPLPLLLGIFEKKGAKMDYRVHAELAPIRREQNAIKRCFFLTDSAKEMRITAMPKLFRRRFHFLSLRFIDVLRKYGAKRSFFAFFVSGGKSFLARVGGYILAVYRAVTGSISFGDCAVVVQTLLNAQERISKFTSIYAAMTENALYLRDLFDFLAYTPKIQENGDGRIASPGKIRFENVSFSYPENGEKLLDEISFTLEPGKKTALVGLNGAGKSTIMKLLLRLYEPDEGRITLGGVDIREFSLASYRRLFFTLPQKFHSFALSVEENIAGRAVTPKDSQALWDALELAGVRERVEAMPKKLSSILTKEFDPTGEIVSGGESQKLRIAALYFDRQAAFCLLDEPSSALDVRSELRLFENLRRAAGERGVLYISHRLSAALEADEILVLEGGRITAAGTHRKLLKESRRYRELFMAQANKYQ